MKTASPTLTEVIRHPATSNRSIVSICATGVLTMALVLARGIGALQAGQPAERAVLLTGVVLAGILGGCAAAYFLSVREAARPGDASLVCLSACAFVLVAIYFFWVASY